MLSLKTKDLAMPTDSSYSKWIKVGYDLFTEDAHEGIQIERLARILGLNKSGFYHYFKDLDTYLVKLMEYQLEVAKEVELEMLQVKKFDPDFINLMFKRAHFLMFQMQLVKNRRIPLYEKTYLQITNQFNELILPHWANFISLSNDTDLALRYFNIVREMFYMRLTRKNCEIEFFRNTVYEAKGIVEKLIEQKAKGVL